MRVHTLRGFESLPLRQRLGTIPSMSERADLLDAVSRERFDDHGVIMVRS